jgi:predicted esterase
MRLAYAGSLLIASGLLFAGGAGAVVPALPPPIDLPQVGPREHYEARLGAPARVVLPSGSLGRAWKGMPGYTAGRSTYSSGEFVYQDTPFDDTGADTVPDPPSGGLQDVMPGSCGSGQAFRHGDYAYPRLPNSSDLVELRIGADAKWYYVLFRLETLADASTTVAALGVDADGLPTGRPGWPGYEHVVEIHGVGVGGSAATVDDVPVSGAVSLQENTFEARVPRAALPGGTWNVAAAVGTWNGSGWAATVDLAFVDEQVTGTFNCWSDRTQSQQIATGGRPSVPVDTSRLGGGKSTAATLERGALIRLYHPSFSLGEGPLPQPKYGQTSYTIYRGTLQPYSVYVPASYDPGRANPLILLLHCLNCNHNTFHISSWPHLRALAESRGAIIATPLAYGEAGNYEEEAEWDVFDVLSDVSARYRIDRTRIYLSGMSMGALGTFRLATLYPDLWARAITFSSYTNPNCVSLSHRTPPPTCTAPFNYWDQLPNVRNIPWGIVNGGLDQLTPVVAARELAAHFDELGFAYRYWEYPTRTHDPSMPGLTTDVTDPFLGDAQRIDKPAFVSYEIDTDIANGPWRLRYDRAYWIRDVVTTPGAGRASVHAVAGRGWVATTAPVSGSGTSLAGPYTMTGRDPTWQLATGPNRLDLTVRAVASLRIRTTETALSRKERLTVVVDSDSPVTIDVESFGMISAPAGTTTVTLMQS